MLPFRARVDLGAMAIKGYSALPRTSALLEPYRLFGVIKRTHVRGGGGGVFALCRAAVGVFYSPSRVGNNRFDCFFAFMCFKSLIIDISKIALFRGHELIPGEILTHKHAIIIWFNIFIDVFGISNLNVHDTVNFFRSHNVTYLGSWQINKS